MKFIAVILFSIILNIHSLEAFYVGTELDAMPFLNKGYYASLWGGKNHLRGRVIIAHLEVPKLGRPKGIPFWEMSVKAYVIDYFLKGVPEGFWIGPGIERWDSRVRNNGSEKRFKTTISTLGIGYAYNFHKHFYINPWAALHIPVGGIKEQDVGGTIFKMAKVTPEASVKIGFYF